MTSSPPGSLPVTIAERKRQVVCTELTSAALRLMTSQGFEATTVEQIVTEAGISRRTFSRYFHSKEDVIVQFLGDLGPQLRHQLAGRPADEDPGAALRHTLAAFGDAYGDPSQTPLRLAELMLSTPALHGRYLERQAEWRADLTEEVARRMDTDARADMRPALMTAAAFAAFDVALAAWVDRGGAPPLKSLVNEAFTLLDTPGNAHL
ncbi:TetR family transcriptional regulator [Streptomyces sp. N2-109]|uniref:TetR family transcriptional regulator n=1 Tax=Streptomyces gossypii TaxID=2883101 RepID=A0ABT2JLW2_9ACTN|nr:TetR family transcriptional regulator [Streptomyces gossypii]MCT2588796.1 TetR family transcriptional regulator [Streptomyces gossypii]